MNIEEMPTRYDASTTEARQYQRWEQHGLFEPDPSSTKPPFTITIPPPNITGSLHMGHALCYPLQDAIGRFQRLKGKNVLILPGQDHAGIATQSVVEKQLRAAGTSGAQIGRDIFVEKVWEWREKSGSMILDGFRRLGCGFSWSHGRFTLDEEYAGTVIKVFIDWFDRGLIFRGKRVVNWDPGLKTSVSDMETERKAIKGKLYHLKYRFKDGSGEIVVATTRPETIIADVAVAVHPSDPRYQSLIGKTLIVPLFGQEIPLISDPYPDPNFGTGALKITPAHDAKDFLVGQRHQLEMPIAIDPNGKLIDPSGRFHGLDRVAGKAKIVEELESLGLIDKIENHDINIVVSERSGEVIEPLLSEQWFCDQAALAGPVIEAVESGEISFTPERYNRIFIEWMEGIREWCLSRQLWWGHRIPVYTAEDGSFVAAESWEQAEAKSGKKIVSQDEDVLDTWFSSGLWPFATLGWPTETPDYLNRYPTDVLVTDRNIINLWVSRMAMMGLDLTNEKPFKDVMIFATVLNEKGQRMSKSLGTGVDPNVVIDEVGSDALRFFLQSQTGANQDIRYSPAKITESRNFQNKIWNATRFVLSSLDNKVPEPPDSFSTIDEWLLTRLGETIEAVEKAYETFNFQAACQELYRFFWNDVCDWYIEISKHLLGDANKGKATRYVLYTSLRAFLTLLHPVMPHLSEELYGFLPKEAGASEFLMTSSWPSAPQPSRDAAAKVELAFEITRTLRALRAELGISPKEWIETAYLPDAPMEVSELIEVMASQAWIRNLIPEKPTDKVLNATTPGGIAVSIPVTGALDPKKELEKIEQQRIKLESDLAKLEARLNNPSFVERAKPEIVEADRELAQSIRAKIAALEERTHLFQ